MFPHEYKRALGELGARKHASDTIAKAKVPDRTGSDKAVAAK